jgi:hypothetical protein
MTARLHRPLCPWPTAQTPQFTESAARTVAMKQLVKEEAEEEAKRLAKVRGWGNWGGVGEEMCSW